jgi:hypothetical protein
MIRIYSSDQPGREDQPTQSQDLARGPPSAARVFFCRGRVWK